MELLLLRHGETRGNREKRYVGRTDEGILHTEKIRLQSAAAGLPLPEILMVSPMKRARETAEVLFPALASGSHAVDSLREMEFGEFEYKNYQEIMAMTDPELRACYQRFIDSGGETAFPGGEDRAGFVKRTAEGFSEALETVLGEFVRRSPEGRLPECVAVVAHGGTIMALLSHYSGDPASYFSWHCDPGCGFSVSCSYTRESGLLFQGEIRRLAGK